MDMPSNSSGRFDLLIGSNDETEENGFNHPDSLFKAHPFIKAGWISRLLFLWPSKVVKVSE